MSGQSGGRKETVGAVSVEGRRGEERGGEGGRPSKLSEPNSRRKKLAVIKGASGRGREGYNNVILKRSPLLILILVSLSPGPAICACVRLRRWQWHAMIICLLCGDQLCQPTALLARSLKGSECISSRPPDLQPTNPHQHRPPSLGGGGGGDMQQLSIKGATEKRREEKRRGAKGSQRDCGWLRGSCRPRRVWYETQMRWGGRRTH